MDSGLPQWAVVTLKVGLGLAALVALAMLARWWRS